MLPPLVQVTAPITRRASGLADATVLISLFLDKSSLFPLARAVATGSVRLMDRVMEHYVHSPDQQQRAVRIDAVTKAMEAAFAAKDLAMVQCIHRHHPNRLGFAVLQLAAGSDSVEILQWLLENRAADDPRWLASYESLTEQHAQRELMVLEILWLHMQDGYRVAFWLFECGFAVDVRSVVGKAMDKEDLAFLQTLPAATRGRVWFVQGHLHSAIRRGQSEIAVWLCDSVGLRPDLRHARIAWEAAIPGMEPYIPAEVRWKMTLVEALSTPYRPGSERLRQAYSVDDACSITNECLRLPFLRDQLARRHDDDFKWLVTERGWSISSLRMPPLVFTEEDRNDIELLELLESHGASWRCYSVPANAAFAGRVDVLAWIYDHAPTSVSYAMAISDAAQQGHLAVLKWFYETFGQLDGSPGQGAAICGHFDAVKWIAQRTEDKTALGRAAASAAGTGHLEIAQWLYENHGAPLGDYCMDEAARQGHVDVVAWVYGIRQEPLSIDVTRELIRYKHTLVAMYLLDNDLVAIAFVRALEKVITVDGETSDFTLLLIERAERAGVVVPWTLLQTAAEAGMPTIVARLCAHRQVDQAQRDELMERATDALRRKRLRQ